MKAELHMPDEKQACPCKRTKCERHGNCEECRKHHSEIEKKPMPACDRLKQKGERKSR